MIIPNRFDFIGPPSCDPAPCLAEPWVDSDSSLEDYLAGRKTSTRRGGGRRSQRRCRSDGRKHNGESAQDDADGNKNARRATGKQGSQVEGWGNRRRAKSRVDREDIEDNDGDMSSLSLCQFWRYRLLLEVVLAARHSDDELEEAYVEEHKGVGHGEDDSGEEVDGFLKEREKRPGPRLMEVRNLAPQMTLDREDGKLCQAHN